MKRTRPFLLMLILSLLVTSVSASEQTGKIAYLTTRDSDGLIYFVVNGARSVKPACATQNYWVIKSENTESGKRQFAALLAARLSGASVKIWGASTCVRWGDGEDVMAVEL